MNCKYCNAEIQDNSKFCNQCGQSIFDTPKAVSSKHIGKALKISITAVALLMALVIAFAFYWKLSSPENKLEGSWSRLDADSEPNNQIFYSFTSEGGTFTTDAQNSSNEGNDEFLWYVTEDDELIILWENGSYKKYTWNPDYTNYKMLDPENKNMYWYVTGKNLYLSNPAAENGYYEYTEYVTK